MKKVIKSRVICEMKIPYPDGVSLSCDGPYSLFLREEGFGCRASRTDEETSCYRVSKTGEILRGSYDHLRFLFFKRRINEELERMRKEYEEAKEAL